MNNAIANLNEVQIWVVRETTPGELVYPTADDALLAYDITYPTQSPEFENSQERAKTRDVIDRCQNQMPPGEYSFTVTSRPNGPGNPPAEHVLLESMAGLVTETPGTNVLYEPALKKPAFSLWVLASHTMFFCSGATVGTATLSIENCPLEWEFGGMFMVMGVTGTESLNGVVGAGVQDIPVLNTDKFSVGGKIALQDATGLVVDDNGGAGYTVDSLVEDTSLHITDVTLVGAAADGWVVPFNPGHTTPGTRLESRTAVVSLNGVEKSVAGFTWTTTDEPEYLDRERTPSGYPESYAETRREVSGELQLIFREDDAEFFKQALESKRQPLSITVGEQAGFQFTLAMPSVQMDMPVLSEVDPLLEQAAPYTALAVTGEDSYSVDYK